MSDSTLAALVGPDHVSEFVTIFASMVGSYFQARYSKKEKIKEEEENHGDLQRGKSNHSI